jgi:hypothetical protein
MSCLALCSADGLVMMSKMSLVLDGILTEPPPSALPPSGLAASSAATAAMPVSAGSHPTGALLTSDLWAWTAGAVAGLPPPVVLIDEGVLLTLQERLKMMSVQMVTVQKEAEYQVGLQ